MPTNQSYLNQGLLVKWQRSIIGATIRMLFRNYYIDSKHIKPKKGILISQKAYLSYSKCKFTCVCVFVYRFLVSSTAKSRSTSAGAQTD